MPFRHSSRTGITSPIPEFDPYGYSPFDPASEHYRGARSGSLPPHRSSGHDSDSHREDRHSRRGSSHHSHHHDGGGRRSRSSATKPNRSLVKAEEDDSWETDYDPRDRFYLSGDDDQDSFRGSGTREPRHESRHRRRDGERRRRSRDHDDERRQNSQRRHHSPRHHSSSRHDETSSRHGDSSSRHHDDSSAALAGAAAGAGAAGAAAASSSRPHTGPRRPTYRRQGSSSGYLSSSRRPKPRHASRSYTSSSAKPRSSRYPPSSSRSVKRGGTGSGTGMANGDFPWGRAARSALQAGAIAALSMSTEPGNWMGPKGGKVATAALGAAVVDGYLGHKHPKTTRGGMRHAAMRQVTEAAIGTMMVKPAANTMAAKYHR